MSNIRSTGARGRKDTLHLPTSPRLNITTTPEIINEAIPKNSGHCIWADSIREAARKRGIDAKSISVDIQTVRFSDPVKRLRYIYLTPRLMQHQIIQFDQGVRPTPSSIKLANGHVVNMPGKRQGKAATITSGRLKRATVRADTSGTRGTFRRVGGKEPPMPSVSTRREFGLRAFGQGPMV